MLYGYALATVKLYPLRGELEPIQVCRSDTTLGDVRERTTFIVRQVLYKLWYHVDSDSQLL